MTGRPVVSVCVPTWNGKDVLARALESVCSQTVADIEVLVGVDACEDGTVAVAREWAANDARISLLIHRDRVGWTRNVNSLLARVAAPYLCLVFHDDTVSDDYLETLLAPMEDNPAAASAYCCVEQIRGDQRIEDRGKSYLGSVDERLLSRLLDERRGSPFRALTRRASVPELRLPEASILGFHAQQAYLFELFAGGPSIYVDDIKYRRIDMRAGGLTDRWRRMEADTVRSDLSAVSSAMLQVLHQRVPEPRQRVAVETALADFLRLLLRRGEAACGADEPVAFEAVSKARCRPESLPPEWAAKATRLREQASRIEARIGTCR